MWDCRWAIGKVPCQTLSFVHRRKKSKLKSWHGNVITHDMSWYQRLAFAKDVHVLYGNTDHNAPEPNYELRYKMINTSTVGFILPLLLGSIDTILTEGEVAIDNLKASAVMMGLWWTCRVMTLSINGGRRNWRGKCADVVACKKCNLRSCHDSCPRACSDNVHKVKRCWWSLDFENCC